MVLYQDNEGGIPAQTENLDQIMIIILFIC